EGRLLSETTRLRRVMIAAAHPEPGAAHVRIIGVIEGPRSGHRHGERHHECQQTDRAFVKHRGVLLLYGRVPSHASTVLSRHSLQTRADSIAALARAGTAGWFRGMIWQEASGVLKSSTMPRGACGET